MAATILVLETDTVLRDLLCEVLEDEGHQVVAGHSLPALLSAVPRDVDLLITDLHLASGTQGFEAIDTVRAATRPELPALICTGVVQVEHLRPEIDRIGAWLLSKPFAIDEFVTLVDSVLHAGAKQSTGV